MPWLGKLVDKISVMGMKVTVITDGSSLLDKAEELDRASMVAVSIPGPENIYRHFRPEGNFERIIEGVKARSARGSVALLVPLGTDSCTCIEEIVNIAEYCGASLIFQPLESASEGCFSEMKSYIATRKQMEKAVQEITGYKRSGVKILNSDRYLQVMTDNWPYKFNRSECCSGKLFLSLGPKGDIYRCGNHFEYGRNDFSCCGCRRYGSLEMNLLRDDITLRNNISSLKNLIGRFSDLYKWWNYWGDDKSSKIRQHKSR